MAQTARERGRQAVDAAGEQVRAVVDQKKWEAAREVTGVASALRDTADRFDNENRAKLARYAHGAADRLDRFSDAVRRQEIGDVARELEDLARRHPGIFVGGCLAAGVVAARYLKASDRRRETDYDDATGAYGNGRHHRSQRHDPGARVAAPEASAVSHGDAYSASDTVRMTTA